MERVSGKRLAVKIITMRARCGTSGEGLRELALWKDVGSNPNVVEFHEVSVHQGLAHVVMEKCNCCLEDRLPDLAALRETDLAFLFRDALLGVAHLHSSQVVHRDVCPSNFLCVDGGGAVGAPFGLKLTDFGLAVRMSTICRLKRRVGSPEYMSPEMLGSQGYDERTDVWSFATMAYRMLFGELPYNPGGETPTAMAWKNRILAGVPAPTFRYDSTERAAPSTNARSFTDTVLQHTASRRVFAEQALELLPRTGGYASKAACDAMAALAAQNPERAPPSTATGILPPRSARVLVAPPRTEPVLTVRPVVVAPPRTEPALLEARRTVQIEPVKSTLEKRLSPPKRSPKALVPSPRGEVRTVSARTPIVSPPPPLPPPAAKLVGSGAAVLKRRNSTYFNEDISRHDMFCGLRWDASGAVDVDVSCLKFKKDGRFQGAVYFADKDDVKNNIHHAGDNAMGAEAGDLGDQESITFNTSSFKSTLDVLLIVATVFSDGFTFADVQNLSARVYDSSAKKELCKYSKADAGKGNALVVAMVYRVGKRWAFKPIDEAMSVPMHSSARSLGESADLMKYIAEATAEHTAASGAEPPQDAGGDVPRNASGLGILSRRARSPSPLRSPPASSPTLGGDDTAVINLMRRFPQASETDVRGALGKARGHAGEAATTLRKEHGYTEATDRQSPIGRAHHPIGDTSARVPATAPLIRTLEDAAGEPSRMADLKRQYGANAVEEALQKAGGSASAALRILKDGARPVRPSSPTKILDRRAADTHVLLYPKVSEPRMLGEPRVPATFPGRAEPLLDTSDPAVTTLMRRFPGASAQQVAKALLDTKGHAGKAAKALQEQTPERPLSSASLAGTVSPAPSDGALGALGRRPLAGTASPAPSDGGRAASGPEVADLMRRFPGATEASVTRALRRSSGHPGRAATLLREELGESPAPTPPAPARASPPSTAGSLGGGEDAAQVANLMRRFPKAGEATVRAALSKSKGHAGKAALMMTQQGS